LIYEIEPMSTYIPTREKALADRKWLVVDAADKPVGRVASQVAALIRGKHKTTFTPHVDTGDFVVVVNAAKLRFTGKKAQQKIYFKHTGYIGNLKETKAGELLARSPEQVLRRAVKGMLPRGPLGNRLILKLKVVEGAEHSHQAQTPEQVAIRG
jgi:large subunit ribosomal protein L13